MVVAASIVVTIVGLGYPGVMSAFNPQPDPPGTEKFPPIGITGHRDRPAERGEHEILVRVQRKAVRRGAADLRQ